MSDENAKYVMERFECAPDLYRATLGIRLEGTGRVFENWQAAADYTRERERQIAEKQEEIEWLKRRIKIFYPCAVEPRRILALLESELKELTRGMKNQEAAK